MERFSGVVILSLFATYGLIGVFKIYGFLMFFGFWVAIFVFFKVIDKLSLKIRKLKDDELISKIKRRVRLSYYYFHLLFYPALGNIGN